MMKDVLLFACELFVKMFLNRQTDRKNKKRPSEKYNKLPKKVLKKIGKPQAFEDEFGFAVPYYQLRAYIKLLKKGIFLPPFFKKLYQLQYLKYLADKDKVVVQRNWCTQFEFYGASLISTICLLAIICIGVSIEVLGSISKIELDLILQLGCYLGIFSITLSVVFVNVVMPHIYAIRFLKAHQID